MEEKSRELLDILRADQHAGWIVDHLVASFAEGISQSAKDADALVLNVGIDVSDLSEREKVKREKYETSRPYSEAEKLELIRFALKELFQTLPAMATATTNGLRELGSTATSVEFSAPDEEERAEGSYERKLSLESDSQDDLRRRLDEFLQRLSS